MRITHDLIARKAGVSRVAVSQVLNKSRAARISPEKRNEILLISQELGYEPRNITTHTIGYVLRLQVLGMEIESQILRELQSNLSARGYRLAIIEMDEQQPEKISGSLNAKTVDGVIFSSWPSTNIIKQLSDEVPYVVVAETDEAVSDSRQVMMDSLQSTRLITEHLIEKGHQRICFVTGLVDTSFQRNVLKGFYAAFEEKSISTSHASLIEVSDANDIEPFLAKEMQKTQPPTAFLGLEFLRTANVINYLQFNGYRVPEDISVAAVFNSKEFGWLRPAVTSTSAGGKHIAAHAVERLITKIENPKVPSDRVIIQSQLIERASVMPPPDIPPRRI